MEKSDIQLVLMVGGSSRIPKVQKMLKKFFNNEEVIHENLVNPDEAVAIGAAVHAAVLNGDYPHSFARDVTPFSLGIDVEGNFMSVLIPRKTPIPVTRRHTYCTVADNQTNSNVNVYEGERASILDNLHLNRFIFRDIPSAPGVEGLEIAMEIDTNGILRVTAQHKRICKKETLRVTAQYGGLMDSQIAEMIEEAQEQKLEDILWKEKVLLKNQLDDCIYYTDKLLQAKKVTSEEEKNFFQNLLSETEKWLKESRINKDKADLEEKNFEIRKLHSKLLECPDKAKQESSKGRWKESKE